MVLCCSWISLAGEVERKNVPPVAEGKEVKSQARSRGEHGVGLVRKGGGQSQWAKCKGAWTGGGGRADSRDTANGTVALLVFLEELAIVNVLCPFEVGHRGFQSPETDQTHNSGTETVISFQLTCAMYISAH